MADENPGVLSHVSIGTNDFTKAVAFYDKVLATLDCSRMLEQPGTVAYGEQFPGFWLQAAFDGKRASTANGFHFGFFATSKAQVDAFYRAAITAGAKDDGIPWPRPLYGKPYYGCFVDDLDGHKIEAAYWAGGG